MISQSVNDSTNRLQKTSAESHLRRGLGEQCIQRLEELKAYTGTSFFLWNVKAGKPVDLGCETLAPLGHHSTSHLAQNDHIIVVSGRCVQCVPPPHT